MTTDELVAEANRLGIALTSNGEKLRVEAPTGALTDELRQALGEHKTEILARLHPLGDGQAPPLDRPPKTEQELRRLIGHLADPEAFTRWLEWAMAYFDPAEQP